MFVHVLHKYLEEKKYRNCTKDTLSNDWYVLRPYAVCPLEQWTQIYYKRASKKAAISNHRELGRLRTFCAWLVENGSISCSPFESIAPPQLEKRIPKSLSRTEVNKLLMTAGSMGLKAKVVVSTFLYTGLRKSELLKLEPHHVNLDEGVLFVNQGKGNKDRLIPLNPVLKELLKEWDKTRPSHYYFFCMSDSTLRRLKKALQNQSSVKFTIHSLRHTFAVLCLEGGVDLFSLQKMMGHSTISITSIYLSSTVDMLQKQILKHPLG